MRVIIDIPEDYYNDLKTLEVGENEHLTYAMELIREGTPLPKGHGRLIDADDYISKHEECGWLDDITINEFNAITPTIIDAYKE